jgi:hypothetical protein
VKGRDLQRGIIDMAHRLGWRVAHFPPIPTTRGGQTWYLTPVAADGKGFPDLMLVRERVVYVEVKGDKDRLRPEQEVWLSSLRMAGQEVHVWRTAEYESGEVESVLRERRRELPADDVAA